jgi:hypothetical protein
MSAAMPAPYVDAFFRFYVDGTIDEAATFDTVRKITGRAPRSFRQWADAHVGEFPPAPRTATASGV